jgi:hypothetical protein
MNFTFSLTHDNLVAETLWSGELTCEIISAGLLCQNQWIICNSDKLPLVLVSDYSKANLNNVTENDLKALSEHFSVEESLFPDVNLILIMPHHVRYNIVRLWIDFSESIVSKAHVVGNYSRARDIISTVLMKFRG